MACFCCGYSEVSEDGVCLNCGEYNQEVDSTRETHGGERMELLESEVAEVKQLVYSLQQTVAAINGAGRVEIVTRKKMVLR